MTLPSLLARSVDFLPWTVRNHIKSVPLVSTVQRLLVNRVMHGREFVHRISAGPAKGLNFEVRMPDDKLYWTGTWESEITTCIAAHMRAGMVCCDVGCHRGFMAGVMLRNGARTAYCFEPNPENASSIERLAKLNPTLDIRLMRYAIGASNGTAQFYIMPQSSMGKLVSSPFQRDAQQVTTFQVQIRTLDRLIAAGEIERPNFVKIDVEGAELDALSGASALVAGPDVTFLVELHSADLAARCQTLFRDAGYRTRFLEATPDLSSEDAFRVCHLLADRQ